MGVSRVNHLANNNLTMSSREIAAKWAVYKLKGE